MTQPSRFRSVRRDPAPESPEALWYALAARRQHESLRGPQQDVLRAYVARRTTPNVALELPTGSGKTAVGLLIAEFHRRQTGKPVAFLTLTRQLGHQVLREATSLGMLAANLLGSADTRDEEQEGQFRTATSVAVSTYSNLFNINPVLAGADLLVLDDAHSGGQIAARMWTVEVRRSTSPVLFGELMAALQPALTSAQRRSLGNAESRTAHLVHFSDLADVSANITTVLDAEQGPVRYPWRLIRDHLESCLITASRTAISIRPLVPPTHTHAPFRDASQRIFMSATIGDPAELARDYGISVPTGLRAEHAQSGRHYIFVPEIACSASEARSIVSSVWGQMESRRALLITPSIQQSDVAFSALNGVLTPRASRIGAETIEDTLDPFTQSVDGILTLARYDGIDLPHEQCRLLLMSGRPTAISDMEVMLRDQWRVGPLLQSREATRLLQGLGRCTRGDTDFAVVVWLGHDLATYAARAVTERRLPDSLRAELAWGLEQSRTSRDDPGSFAETLRLLISDQDVRADADESIRESVQPPSDQVPTDAILDSVAPEEIRAAQAAWEGDWDTSYKTARRVADQLGSDPLSGYRAWWWYLAASAASRAGQYEQAADCLNRARACGVNAAFLAEVAKRLPVSQEGAASESLPANVDGCWAHLDDVGWAGLGFQEAAQKMQSDIDENSATRFHMGVEALGRMLGADSLRPTGQGDPDIVWSFSNNVHIAFEAKTEKTPGSSLSKRELLEASGHISWIASRVPGANQPDATILSVIVAPESRVDAAAAPQVGDLRFLTSEGMRTLATASVTTLAEARAQFAGADFTESATSFTRLLEDSGLTFDRLVERVAGTTLASLQS